MRLHLDLSCVKLNKTEDQLRNTQEKLEKFEKITRKLEEKVIGLENRHTWKVTGINSLLSTLKPETAESAPFYTRKYGYKFEIRLYSRRLVDGFWKRRFLSMYFILMKGEYDTILPWPFNEKVTFTLIDQQEDQNERENIVGFIPPNPYNSSWNQRPV